MKSGILLSGGIDSACLAYWKKPDHAFFVDYGQKPVNGELRAAQAISAELNIPLEVLQVDLHQFGLGDLVGKEKISSSPTTEWWPFRNQMLVTLALMRAFPMSLSEIIVGLVRSDLRHKDGTEEFLSQLDSLSRMQEGKIRVVAPGMPYSSTELCLATKVPMSILGWTHSCHRSDSPCGKCNGCLKHLLIKKSLIRSDI